MKTTKCAFFVFLKYKPIVVIGTGGYISAVPLMLGVLFRKKIFIQEQNIIPGKTTKLFNKYAEKIFIGFNHKYFYKNKKNLVYSGNPIRKFNSSEILLNEEKKEFKTILIIGGSQGAEPINDYFINNHEKLTKNNIFLIWQCGQKNFNEVNLKIKDSQNIQLVPFINNMEKVYFSSDLVISRAGAISISELMIYNKPAIFIPYPYAADNHQYENAKYIESKDAGIYIKQSDMNENLINKIKEIIGSEADLNRISKNTKKIAQPRSTEIISKEIMNCIK